MITLDLIKQHAADRAGAVALEHGGATLTWSNYASSVERVARYLDARVRAPDATAVLSCEAGIAAFIAASALATVRIPWVALDPARPAQIRAQQVAVVSPAVMVTDHGGVTSIACNGGPSDSLADIIEGSVSAEERPTPDRPFRAIGFTSGTTGMPKLVRRSRSSEKRRNALFVERFGFTVSDRFLLCLPLSHASGHGWARTFLGAGATVVVGSPRAESIAERLIAGGITATLVVPPVLDELIHVLDDRSHDQRRCGQLRFLLTGGRHLSPGTVGRATRALGPVLHCYYGTTETGVNAIAEPSDLIADPRTAGYALDGSDIIVLDQEQRAVAPGESGRVAIASYMNADTYGDVPIPTVRHNGRPYIVTADIGVLATDGELRILGRADERAPAPACGDLVGFESDLRLLAGVAEAAVVVREPEVADVVMVTPEPPSDRALLHYLAGRVGEQRDVRLRVRTHFSSRLVHNSTGKLDVEATLDATC